MNEHRVEFITHTKHSNVVVHRDRFEFREDRPAHWLQRLCIWTLKKLKAYARDNEISFTRHVIEPKKFVELLYQQRQELFRTFNLNGTRLLIGSEDYAEMMNQMLMEQPFEFQAQYMRNGVNGRTFVGLTVEVIPWMRGILVMP